MIKSNDWDRVKQLFNDSLELEPPDRGEARLRCQISAGHDTDQLDQAVEAFATVGKELGLI